LLYDENCMECFTISFTPSFIPTYLQQLAQFLSHEGQFQWFYDTVDGKYHVISGWSCGKFNDVKVAPRATVECTFIGFDMVYAIWDQSTIIHWALWGRNWEYVHSQIFRKSFWLNTYYRLTNKAHPTHFYNHHVAIELWLQLCVCVCLLFFGTCLGKTGTGLTCFVSPINWADTWDVFLITNTFS
jgi:hypothetical protein